MNYYERHLGDYARDTAHLSMLEHGAFTLLLDRYYATEQPIPADQVHRLARARTREERVAVDAVVGEFFELQDGHYVNRRAAAEIENARRRIEAARQNGRNGGRPPRKPNGFDSGNPDETHEEPGGLFLGSETETQQKALQSPDSNHQRKNARKRAPGVKGCRIPDDFRPDLAEAVKVIADLDAAAEAERFRDYWTAQPGAKAMKTNWPATWRNWIRTCRDTGRYAKRRVEPRNPLDPTSGIEMR